MLLILKIRKLTIKLVSAIKRWKELVKKPTATFTVKDAMADVGSVSALGAASIAKNAGKAF